MVARQRPPPFHSARAKDIIGIGAVSANARQLVRPFPHTLEEFAREKDDACSALAMESERAEDRLHVA